MTIGQFSRVCWLSVKALRLYDEAGLLHPVHVDPETNYRYYKAEQAGTARAIAMLRTLDMPLTEIKDIVTESDIDKIRARLDSHRSVLEDRIDRNRHMLQRVEDFIRKGAVMTYDITIKEVDPVDVIGSEFQSTLDTLSPDIGAAMGEVYEKVTQAEICPSGPPRVVYHEITDDEWTVEACIPVTGVEKAPQGLTLRKFDGGKMASTLHVGPYHELGMVYREIEVWIEKQNLKSAGAPFDVYLNDPSEVKDPTKFETEILWPVR
jgi:effector-binding domain-containing protein